MLDAHGGSDLPYLRVGQEYASKPSSSASNGSPTEQERGPFPLMPSQTFFNLANSQFELLSNSIHFSMDPSEKEHNPNHMSESQRRSKIKSIGLYLPQENPQTGQLEFLPSIVYPSHPKSERIFIASDAKSGVAPTIPKTLTQLPGFSHASTLIPAYPFIHATSTSSTSGGGPDEAGGVVGTPEEVFCDLKEGSSTALSLPLRSGPQTIGILLVWGAEPEPSPLIHIRTGMWTQEDKNQISRVGETLALALEMDSERFRNRIQTESIRVSIADNLHQVKNPVQALRTFSKLLQRNLATDGGGSADLERLADDIFTQSERVVDLLRPFDSILNSMDGPSASMGMDMVGLNSYQRLLAPKEMTGKLVLAPNEQPVENKSMQTDMYLGSLSKSEQSNDAKKDSSSSSDVARLGIGIAEESKEDKRIELQMSFLPDVLQPILSPSKTLSADLGIEMEIIGGGDDAELPGVSVNPKLLQEAVVNVLDNAIKYVSYGYNGEQGVENPNPRIRVTLAANDDNLPPGATISIEDNGPGILSGDESAIFKRGYRSEHTKAITKGSGIGLDISRDLVAAMGGSLDLLVPTDNKQHPKHLGGAVMQFVLYRKPKVSH